MRTTVAVYTTRSILQFAAYQGANIETLCATVGLDPEILNMPDQRIPGSLHLAVWREAVKQTGNKSLGLHLGEAFNLANFGIPGYVLLNCQTLAELLEKFARYNRLFCQLAQVRVSVSGRMVFFECNCDCDLPLHQETCELEELRYSVECTFASLLTLVKNITGKPLRLSAAWFQYEPPDNAPEYEQVFQTTLQFVKPVNSLIFDASCLDWKILTSNASLLPLFEQHAEAMLDAIDPTQSYTQKVIQAIAHQLRGELPTIPTIARELAISVRQLQRELRAEGTSFQKLFDRTRQELALQHLKDPTAPINDIAFLLGFSDPSAFNRAFKRWTGKTPRSYRLESGRCERRQSSVLIECYADTGHSRPVFP
ncbi:MAG TPA: AraC family transcriptional regulator [Coleofasciculaceae cyanobacterium]